MGGSSSVSERQEIKFSQGWRRCRIQNAPIHQQGLWAWTITAAAKEDAGHQVWSKSPLWIGAAPPTTLGSHNTTFKLCKTLQLSGSKHLDPQWLPVVYFLFKSESIRLAQQMKILTFITSLWHLKAPLSKILAFFPYNSFTYVFPPVTSKPHDKYFAKYL